MTLKFAYDTDTYEIVWRYWGDKDVEEPVDRDVEVATKDISREELQEIISSADPDEDERWYLEYDPDKDDILVTYEKVGE